MTARGIQSEACKHSLGSAQTRVHHSLRKSHADTSHIVHNSYLNTINSHPQCKFSAFKHTVRSAGFQDYTKIQSRDQTF